MQITRQQWWLIGGAIGGVLILVALVVVLMNIRASRQVIDLDPRVQSERRMAAAYENCPLNQDESDCLYNAVVKEAKELMDAEVCEALEGDQRSDCVRVVALASGNADDCRILSGDARADCRDATFGAVARAQVNLAVCERIESAQLSASCIDAVTTVIVQQDACSEYAGVDASLCNQRAIMRQALELNSESVCEQLIEDEQVAACVDAVREQVADLNTFDPDTDQDGLSDEDEARFGTSVDNADTDGDGLTDGEEVNIYATEPLNPDTDRDGFGDGEEVQNGYNPAGPGSL